MPQTVLSPHYGTFFLASHKQKAVCFADVTLFIYFTVEAQMSAFAGRIFVMFMPFNRVLLQILFSVQTSDRSAL